jgi:hypothetical protein
MRTQLRAWCDTMASCSWGDDLDVHLGWHDGELQFAYGDVSYDATHWEVCVAGSLAPTIKDSDLRELARTMANDLRDEIAALEDE